MLTVEKIGGTSMSRFDEVLKNIILKNNESLYNRVIVVSAYGGVTNLLLEDKHSGKGGIYTAFSNERNYRELVAELLEKMKQINSAFREIGLDISKADSFVQERIERTCSYLQNISELIGSGYADKKNILMAAREILASAGEAHSAFNTVNILNNNGINAQLVDLSGFNDSDYLTIDERIARSFKNIDFKKSLPIATGYTKGTEGIMREFQRGYTEVTFAKIAVELGASEAVIHKEYHLCSADPEIVGVERAIPVGYTNYDVADQLADIWMEAVHPKVSKALELAGINLRIKNAFDPDHPGTLISKSYLGKASKVELVSGNESVLVVEIHDPSMVGAIGFDMDIMSVFVSCNISYIMKATNANSISMVIQDTPEAQPMIRELKRKFFMVTARKAAIVCIMGSNIAKPGILAKASRVLSQNNINIDCVSQSLRQVNIQFLISRRHYKKAIEQLNQVLCLE
ncbi:MAG: aspartate kinase [Spirochaetia bacterium]